MPVCPPGVAGMALLAVPVAVVHYGRRVMSPHKAAPTADLLSIASASEYSLVPEGVTDLVSLKSWNGLPSCLRTRDPQRGLPFVVA